MKHVRLHLSWLALSLLVFATCQTLGASRRNVSGAYFNEKETSTFLFGNYLQYGEDGEGDWGAGYSIDYFASQWFGLGITSHWERWSGVAYDNLGAEAIIRIPIQSWRLAPYGIGTVGYDFEENEWFQGAGGGLEFRFSPKFGLAADYQYLWRDTPDDGGFIRFGLRIGF